MTTTAEINSLSSPLIGGQGASSSDGVLTPLPQPQVLLPELSLFRRTVIWVHNLEQEHSIWAGFIKFLLFLSIVGIAVLVSLPWKEDQTLNAQGRIVETRFPEGVGMFTFGEDGDGHLLAKQWPPGPYSGAWSQ